MKTLKWISIGACALAPTVALGTTLETVQSRDSVRCGVNAAQPGFSSLDDNDTYRGLDTDVCRAIAAAAFQAMPARLNSVAGFGGAFYRPAIRRSGPALAHDDLDL